MQAGRRTATIGLGDCSGGVFTVEPAVSARQNQVSDSINAMFRRRGFARWPGMKGLSATQPVDTVLSGIGTSMETDGDEHLFASDTGGKIYEVNTGTGVFTELIDNNGALESEYSDFRGTTFVCNGQYPVKIEGSAASRVGIAAPSSAGCTASAVAGGSLPDGTYKVKIGYARKVSGSVVLYSQGTDLANVVLGTGSNTIRIATFANSSDGQVNDKVIWLTDAGGSVYYFYHETGDNTTTTVDISSASSRNVNLVYETQAGDNYLPGSFEHLLVFNDTLWGSIANVAYCSKRAGTVYDLERFPADNYLVIPYQITGIFAVGEHLYFNTPRGVWKLPNGDLSARSYRVGAGYRWYRMQTVGDWGSLKIGLTNDGVRTFDGERFSDIDYGKDVKNLIAKCYTGQSIGFRACGGVYRRSNRTEYHLSYMDTSVGVVQNNRRLVLNLDRVMVASQDDYIMPWEICDHGCNFMAVTAAGALYMSQSISSGSLIYQEDLTTTFQQYTFSAAGAFSTAQTPQRCHVVGRHVLTDMAAEFDVESLYLLVQVADLASVRLWAGDAVALSGAGSVSGVLSPYEVSLYEEDEYVAETPTPRKVKMPANLKGRILYFEFDQTANDVDMRLVDVVAVGTLAGGRFV